MSHAHESLCRALARSKRALLLLVGIARRISALQWRVCLLLGLWWCSSTSPLLAEQEILAGRSAAGQLKIAIDFDQPIALPRSIFPGISGYATGELGLHSTILDEPANDFYQLSPAADFRFILLAKDAGMEVWNDTGSGYMGIGESFYVGPAPFDTHPIWNIVSGIPGNSYSLTLKLHDLNGVYSDSTPFVLTFTPIAPAQLKIRDNGDNTVTVTFHGTAGAEYIVQAASHLTGPGDWRNVATNTAATDGSWTYTESKSGQTQRYYRCANQ